MRPFVAPFTLVKVPFGASLAPGLIVTSNVDVISGHFSAALVTARVDFSVATVTVGVPAAGAASVLYIDTFPTLITPTTAGGILRVVRTVGTNEFDVSPAISI